MNEIDSPFLRSVNGKSKWAFINEKYEVIK